MKAATLILLCMQTGIVNAQQAMLWIPAPLTADEEIVDILETRNDLRLTAAFTELPEGLKERLLNLEKAGRLEIAFRPAGDPPLPLLYYPALETVKWEGKLSTSAFDGNNQQFLMFRLSRAHDTAVKNLKKAPSGLVIPPGGIVDDYFPLARAIGIKWLACGPLVSTAAVVLVANGISAVPFFGFSTAAPTADGLRFTVFDETSENVPSVMRARLAAELRIAAPGKTLTVSEALKSVVPMSSTPADISRMSSPWSGDYTPWASAPLQRAALVALAKTRSDLMLYLNERGGNYNAAKQAFEEYFAAENGEKILMLASVEQEARREAETVIRNAIGNTYRWIKKTPSAWILSSLPGGRTEIPEIAERLYITSGPDGFEIKNISRKPEIPASVPPLPETADPYKIWKLDKLKVEVLPETIIFRFSPLDVENAKQMASGFDHIALDLYMDINRQRGAGRSRPLSGRPFRFFPDSAWEYALEINPEKAVLYKATAKGPAVAGSFLPKFEDGAVIVMVPRSALKGNPLYWGYAAFMLAPKNKKRFTLADYMAANISNGYIHCVRPGRK